MYIFTIIIRCPIVVQLRFAAENVGYVKSKQGQKNSSSALTICQFYGDGMACTDVFINFIQNCQAWIFLI
jgi:hypothetical protein